MSSYLTNTQIETVLQNPYYTQSTTQSAIDYRLFRGRFNVTVHTLRFNLNSSFTETMMLNYLYNYLTSVYNLNTHLLATVDYDLLLGNNSSFYIWRANSNATIYNTNDIYFPFTYHNLYVFARQALKIHLPTLNMYFRTSNVNVIRPLAIVFSFVHI